MVARFMSDIVSPAGEAGAIGEAAVLLMSRASAPANNKFSLVC